MGKSSQEVADQALGPTRLSGSGQSFRHQGVFFLGDHLPLRETLEMLFASDCESPVELFHFTFSKPTSFVASLPLAHQVQKNFKGYRLAQFLYTPSVEQLDAAYAAGFELIDLPLFTLPDQEESSRRREALRHARTLLARWMVVVTLHPQAAPPTEHLSIIDGLLHEGILPLLQNPAPQTGAAQEWLALQQLLTGKWRHNKVNLRPLAPLLRLRSPLLAEPPRKGVNGLLEKASEAGQRAAADLRRLLRVRGAEQSFDSAAL